MSRPTGARLSMTQRPVRGRFASTGKRLRNADAALARDLLASGGCPVCGFADSREGKFFLWFGLEHYLDFGTIERLDAALGMCPRHCRALIATRIYPGTLTNIYGHVVRAALRRLGGSAEDGECVACEHERWAAGHAIGVVGKTLGEEAIADSFRDSRGFCAPHFLRTLRDATPETAAFLLEVFIDRLGDEHLSSDAVKIFTGTDPDAEMRAVFLQQLPEDPLYAAGRAATTRDRLVASLRADCCPACLAAGQAGRRYLRWIGEERRRSEEFGRDVAGTCPAHLADLARLDPESAEWLAREKVSLWRGLLSRFHDQNLFRRPRGFFPRLRGRSPDPSLRGEARRRRTEILAEFLRETLTPRRHWERAVRGLVVQLPLCGARDAEKTAASRTAALLLVSVEDASQLPLYESSHGLCVRHVLALPEAGNAVPLRVCRARLDWLAWELDEAGRKQSWLVRYEKRGEETNAWRRAMAQVDGRVFLGGDPAVAL